MQKKWKIRVIHFTHTDIGYKDVQERIINNHVNYLENIVNRLCDDKSVDGWKWTIETFYLLEVYWKKASSEQKKKIKKLISENKIGVSANFLNFSEVISQELYENTTERITRFMSEEIGKPLSSFVTNDINGFSRSWATSLTNNDIVNGYFGLHAHHGMFPAFRKQHPFYWKLPNGKKMLTWVGEQYAFGNNLGLVKGPISDYISKDGLTAGVNEKDQIKLANKRISEYIKILQESDYAFDVVPITVLGTGSDNDPANFDILARVEILKNEWKSLGIEDVRMVTLDEFFEEANKEIEEKNINIPTYEGEWPDWWTDGVGSSPYMSRAFREAQRKYRVIKTLGYDKKYQPIVDNIENSLLCFAEHTFGGEDSISDVHSFYHFSIEKLKWWYALDALQKTSRLMDYILDYKIDKTWEFDNMRFTMENPLEVTHTYKVNLAEFMGVSERESFPNGWNIKSSNKSITSYIELIKHHSNPEWSQKHIYIEVEMAPKEKCEFTIEVDPKTTQKHTTPFDNRGADLVKDVHIGISKPTLPSYLDGILESKYFKIVFDNNGIVELWDKEQNKNIISGTLFVPRYEVHRTDYKRSSLFLQRRFNGRNKKNFDSEIHNGEFKYKNVEFHEGLIHLTLRYEIEGSKFYEVILKWHNDSKTIHSEVNIVKDTEWNMESMFIELPFVGRQMLDKDYLYEPGVDQIPGSLTDYHSIQDGIVYNDNVFLASLDHSLIWTGSLEYQDRQLSGQTLKKYKTYGWILNNLWETNFSPDLGGMHQFRYIISVDSNIKNKKDKLFAMSISPIVKRKM